MTSMTSTWSRFVRKLEVDQTKTAKEGNDGNKPTPPEACTWGSVTYLAVFPWPSFCIATWTSGSVLLAFGLTVGQAMGAATIAIAICTLSRIYGGLPGSQWRLSGPLTSRLAWGTRGFIVVIFNQILIPTIWYGVQLVFGYLSVKVVIGAIAPSFLQMHNSLSDSLPTNDFICMIIFLAASLVLQWFPPSSWALFGKIGGLGTLITFIALVVICTAEAGGTGPLLKEPFGYIGSSRTLSRGQAAWGFFLAISMKLSNAGMINSSNYARYARNNWSPVPGLIVNVMILELLVTFFGILATSAAIDIFEEDKLLWAPYDLLLAFQKNGSAGARAGTFFAGLFMIVPQLGINAMWNAYSVGINWAMIFPRWISVRRGGYLTACLGVAIQPWRFAKSPGSFGLFLNGGNILSGALSGILASDYFLVRKQVVKVSDTMADNETSIYWYTKGCNWRAFLTLLLTAWLPLPGWISVIRTGRNTLEDGWQKLYGLAWPLAFVLAAVVYGALSRLWPPEGLGIVDESPTVEEHIAKEAESGRTSVTATVSSLPKAGETV